MFNFIIAADYLQQRNGNAPGDPLSMPTERIKTRFVCFSSLINKKETRSECLFVLFFWSLLSQRMSEE